jgi:TRAP-type mannitol/chloroaromatic compound transport system permease large subunit
MTGILELKGLSSEAKIGKIILIVSLVLSIVAVILVILAGAMVAKVLQGVPGLFVQGLYILALVKVAGIILGVISLYSTTVNHWKSAGILALVSSIIPPLDLLMLVSGLFFLLSPEAKGEETGEP